jgi:hypothetical protein
MHGCTGSSRMPSLSKSGGSKHGRVPCRQMENRSSCYGKPQGDISTSATVRSLKHACSSCGKPHPEPCPLPRFGFEF